jgi:hypothetical protein
MAAGSDWGLAGSLRPDVQSLWSLGVRLMDPADEVSQGSSWVAHPCSSALQLPPNGCRIRRATCRRSVPYAECRRSE